MDTSYSSVPHIRPEELAARMGRADAPLLLDVWREIGRHFEIRETIERIAPLLARRLPVERILVRRLDLARSGVETAAASPALDAKRDTLASGSFQELAAWCQRGRPARATAVRHPGTCRASGAHPAHGAASCRPGRRAC